ncbi:amino acid adenylation domain-containing protein [Mesorhizobium sp. M0578]|uniref:amino acid adenylation domain-containing protein n=1 Tax=unclassified Mesorhizobium TaxID=325217 RepID=UPI00333BA9BA
MGHDIRAVLCADAIFASWAARANVPRIASVAELSSFLKTEPVEWIFSVVNPFILPADVLGRISQGAFNYHDGPLPRYAGTHATSWALLAQETEHAVTWHRIADGVNTGEVAVQRQVLVTPADTALTLNLKCYEAAVEGFRELLIGLAGGKLSTRPQALKDRSHFPRHRRPDAAGILRWDRSAQDLSAMTRALDFGLYHPNPLCLCKALVGEEVVAVRRLEVLPRRSGFAAGRLLEIHPSHWRVATGTQDVDVWFGSLDGQALEARALASRCNLDEGEALPVLSDNQVRRLTAIHEEIAPSEDFWRRRLEQFKIVQPPFLSSGTIEAPAGWQSSSWLSPGALAELSAIDRVEYLVTAWLIYLARITGQAELQLGWRPAPTASRAGVQAVEAIIASAVPMEVTIDLADDFKEIRKAVAAECAQLRKRDSFARDLIGRCPSLKGMEALRSHLPWPVGMAIAAENSAAVVHSASKVCCEAALPGELLTFEVCVLDGSFRWHFDASRLAPEQVERMTQHLQALLCGVLADAGQPVGRIELLSATERGYLLEELNRTAAPYPSERCIHELFEAQVREAPDRMAVVHKTEELSYGELNARANRLAHHLIGLGVKPDQPVAICLERSPAMVVGVLAILKAGGAYVPLDPAYPSTRLNQVLEDAAPRLLLCDAAGRAALGADAPGQVSVVDLDTATPAWAGLPPSNPDPRALGLTSRHLAYIIYTSGSTGTPKGVMVEHRGLVNLIAWHVQTFCPQPETCCALTAASAFDASAWELWSALYNRSTLLLPPRASAGDSHRLLQWWRDQSLFAAFLVTPLATTALEDNLVNPTLEYLLIGGDRLQRVPSLLPSPLKLINNYGPTEVTVVATSGRIFSDNVVPHIGRPIANTRVYLLDNHGAPVPFGAVGELYIGGAGVARGYLNRPELTAERFIASPFVEGDRLYKTGDLARYLPDGNLEFLGRNDDQVKIRGFRIEPGETAARLVEHERVRDAVVVAREDRAGQMRLVAYVVCAPQAGAEDEAGAEGQDPGALAGALHAHLGARLPDYMVPSAFVWLAALPLTPNGKLDRKALPVPADDAYARAAYAAPQCEIETALAAIWAELLGLERVGRRDHFFELGGHSLLAVQLLSRASNLGLKLSASDLFRTPVLKDLALKVKLEPQPSSPGAISIRATGSQPSLFFVPTGSGDCSYAVKLVSEMDIDCPAYAVPWPDFNELCPPTLEEIAAQVIEVMKEIQPSGPYRLAGYSSGGILAYAIAQHLLKLGEAVSFLAFIDVALPANASSLSPTKIINEGVLVGLESLGDERFAELERFAEQSSTVQLLEKAQEIGAIPVGRDLHTDISRYAKAATFQRMLDVYEAPSLPVEIHQFYANGPRRRRARPPKKSSPDTSSPLRGWQRILSARAIHALPIPGDHETMMSASENRQVLAQRLSTALNMSSEVRI